tara:strand:+ start:114 stop:1034 length:921 start_codon:yes stop_codon:yes gene_type:complete
MSVLNQKTIKNVIIFNGVGLHTGKKVNLKLLPAKPNSGIIFKRTDLKDQNIILPGIFNVSNATLCTTISNEHGNSVMTIEHLMAAIFGKGIDNLLIEIDSVEVPILDGSAKEFVKEIDNTGLEISETPIKIIKIEKKVIIREGNKFISIEPNNLSLDIDFEIKFKNPIISNQRKKIKVYEDNLNEIYESRTFCLYQDIDKLKKMKLAIGGSLDNAIVVKDNEILNEGGLRNKNEFVNHKILDCLGDLYLSGYKMLAKVICSQGGHYLTNQLMRKTFEDKKNFSIIEIKEKNVPHSFISRNQLKSIA